MKLLPVIYFSMVLGVWSMAGGMDRFDRDIAVVEAEILRIEKKISSESMNNTLFLSFEEIYGSELRALAKQQIQLELLKKQKCGFQKSFNKKANL